MQHNTSIPLESFLSSIHKIDHEILHEYVGHWTEHAIARKTIMTSEGETERFLYFVVDGIQKSYYLNEGKQHVIAFAYPPSFSGIPDSFLTQSPSAYFLETITDSVFLRLSFERHQELMNKHRPIETLFRKATEQLLLGMIQRHYELMAFDIERRFRAFTRRSPQLINMVPHKDISSYLRIDATNFSKLLGSVRM
ncbi:MAG: Crp/Fnr family transcriptional regulator [Flammeovirgaceae bacterium]|nr:Crp/Fnr family transcriptional regulator [Flammeovirgaceae bacterium]